MLACFKERTLTPYQRPNCFNFSTNTFNLILISLYLQHVGQTWNNRRDRPKEVQPDDQLLVFGYASKLFPPDEQSAKIAKNKHMIAWNEDFKLNLLIDR